MNKHLYRIIFNKARGLLMVVAETLTSAGKASGTSDAPGEPSLPPTWASLRPASFSLLMAFGSIISLTGGAQAQVVSDPGAPKNQQPTILTSANGTPQVNIQTPSAAGVSRNVYSQFDVNQQGVILNNARNNAQTQLGGWVQGNPWLAAGTARVILNEVNSSNPSQLRGYVEVAGDRAQVVIANPAGISCDGCGFINANRATLTSGTPVMNGGNIDGYRVQDGAIAITGAGFDASRTDYADLIARTIQINAGVWANQLKITAGANLVDAGNDHAKAIAGGSAPPVFAIDVAQLGGMYAGKITLIGTEAGVGVRNAGMIGASTGEVIVTVDGRLENAGRIASASHTRIDANDGLQNSGTLYAQGDAQFKTRGNIDNSGVIAAQGNTSLAANGLNSQINSTIGSVLGAGIQGDGSIGPNGSLTLSASQDVTAQGQNLSGGDLSMTAQRINLAGSSSTAQNAMLKASDGDIELTGATLAASQGLVASASQTLRSDHAKLSAMQINVNAHDISNIQGDIVQLGTGDLTLELPGTLDNTRGRIAANSTNLNVLTGNLANTDGKLEHAGTGMFSLQASNIDNSHGIIGSNGLLDLVSGSLSNGGTLSGNTGVTISTSALVNNAMITSNGDLSIVSGDLTNNATLSAYGALTLTAGNLTNTGTVASNGTVRLDVSADMNNLSDVSGNVVQGSTGGNLSNAGSINAKTLLVLDALNLSNTGALISNGKLAMAAAGTLINGGVISSDGRQELSANDLVNSGTMTGQNDLSIQLSSTLINSGSILAGGDATFHVANLYNRPNAEIWVGNNLSITRDAAGNRSSIVSNERATIETQNGNLLIKAEQLDNLGSDPTGYITSSGVSDYIGLAWRPSAYAAEIARAPDFYDKWVYYVPDLAQYKSWLPYRQTDKRVQFRVSGTVQSIAPDFVAEPGRIRSGHDLTIDVGTGTNQYSHITAANDITLTGDAFANTGAALLSSVNIQVSYENGDATQSGSNGVGHWPNPHIYLPLLSSTQYHPGVLSVIGAGGKINASGLTSLTNNNGQSSSGYIGTGSNNTGPQPPGGNVPVVALGHGVTLSPGGQLNFNGVPTGGLFVLAPNGSGHPLIETNPLFANYRQWLSSDYLLNALALDPNTTQKRLGDGFYEQRLVREQIAQLTGRPYLFSADHDDEYQHLLTNAVHYAEAWNLRPGIALTPQQMAQLTDDIVWLEERLVGDQRVLVPQLYLAPNSAARISATGALFSANDIQLAANSIVNSGTIDARSSLALTAVDFTNQNGIIQGGATRIVALNDFLSHGGQIGGDTVTLLAGRDLTLNAATVQANTSLDLAAGRDLTLGTITENYAAGGQQGQGYDETWSTSGTIERRTLVQSNGTLTATAGRDLSAIGATLGAQGDAVIAAGNNLTLDAAAEQHQSHSEQHKGSWKKSSTAMDHSDTTHLGSAVVVGGRLDIQAGNDLTIRGSDVVAQKDLTLTAGNDLTLASVQNTQSDRYQHSESQSGFSFSMKGGLSYGSSSQTQNTSGQNVTQVGSSVSGANVDMSSGRDTRIVASTVLADKNIDIAAGRNIDILAAANTDTTQSEAHSSTTSIGLMSGMSGNLTIFGSSKGSENGNGTATTQSTSLLSANSGNLTLHAGLDSQYKGTDQGNITAQGADLLAKEKIALSANAIDLQAIANTTATRSHSESKSFTIGARPAGAVGGLINQIVDRAIAVHEGSGNSRLDKAMALKAGYDTYKLFNLSPEASAAAQTSGDAVKGGLSGGAFGVSVSIGSSKSESNSQSASSQALGTNVQAKEITLTARETDIHLQAAKLQAENITLDAARDVRLEAAANTSSLQSDNKSSSASVGVTFTFGQQTGISFQLGMQNAKGKANGSETVYDNTLITATDTLKIRSGNDTTLKGAQLAANQVTLDVGRNLGIETLQDLSKYESEYKSSGFGLNLCIPPLCYGLSSGSVNASSQQIKHNYQSAVGQSGIAAGDGGFDIKVGQKTELVGAAITSTADSTQNKLSTGSLTSRDLSNTQTTDAKASSLALNASFGSGAASALTQGANNIAPNVLGNKALNEGLPQSGSEQSQTLSVISPAQIKITGSGDAERDAQSQATADTLTQRDPKTANQALTNTLTLQQVAELEKALKTARQNDEAARLLAQTGQEAHEAWGKHANAKFAEALNIGDEEGMRCWGPDGTCRAGGHAVLGGLVGGIGGAAGAGLSSVAAPHVQAYLIEQGIPPTAASAVTQLAAIGGGAAVGGTQGAMGALNEATNNAALAIPLIIEQVIAGGTLAIRTCLSSPACTAAVGLAGGGAVAKLAELLPPEYRIGLPGYGENGQPLPNGPLVTPIPNPKEMQKLYGTPPLENPDALQSWLANALEGYPADEAEKWARDLIHTLPMADQQHYSDLIIQQVHHICTDKNCISPNSGGPWTPEFQKMFDKAGISMQNELNKVWVAGHQGPHPAEYHREVFDRLSGATQGKSGDAYTQAFQKELTKIGGEIRTPGTRLNELVTKK